MSEDEVRLLKAYAVHLRMTLNELSEARKRAYLWGVICGLDAALALYLLFGSASW